MGIFFVLRFGGIDLKDGLLFIVFRVKIEGKDVGILECEGVVIVKFFWKVFGKYIFSV